jgi:predicted CopG family antitoxin
MPYKGYKSITVRDEIYDKLWNIWEKRKDEYHKQGITSFSGFVTRFLYELLEEEKKQAHE